MTPDTAASVSRAIRHAADHIKRISDDLKKPRVDLTWEDVASRAWNVASLITSIVEQGRGGPLDKAFERHRRGMVIRIYGVPRGGVYAAQAVAASRSARFELVEQPEDADVLVDDIIDSGNTKLRYERFHTDVPFIALVDKLGRKSDAAFGWVSFPWERMTDEVGPEENIRRLIQYVGDDPDRPGLAETPSRVVRSYAELFAGYKQDPTEIFKTFDDIPYDEMIVLKDVDFQSWCEHHMLPFSGVAHVAYIPEGKAVIGLSKMARLVDVFARRLQVQERLTVEIAEALQKGLNPKGVGVIVEASHSCMTCRGVRKPGARMVTSKLIGAMKEKPEARLELLALAGYPRR